MGSTAWAPLVGITLPFDGGFLRLAFFFGGVLMCLPRWWGLALLQSLGQRSFDVSSPLLSFASLFCKVSLQLHSIWL